MKHEVESIFLFIAELTGSYKAGTGTQLDKTECGRKDYIKGYLPSLDLNCEEDRKDLHEVIWLKRLYNELDDYFNVKGGDSTIRGLKLVTEAYRDNEKYKWTVPIELDASASAIQIMGVLLNDRRLMDMTNVIGNTLNDPWKIDGIPRNMLKKAATPMIYGSSKQCHELWQDSNMSYTPEHVKIYNKEMSEGAFGLVNSFKEFIINNANTQETMKVNIHKEKFTIKCNRFKTVGEKTKAYKAWDSIDGCYRTVLHTDTKQVPDLKQFRRFLVTGLVHCLDSQIADYVANKTMDKYNWCIPIYDAFVISPSAAIDVRKWYAEALDLIHKDRKSILTNYFKSIGITGAATDQWNYIQSKVDRFNGELSARGMALK